MATNKKGVKGQISALDIAIEFNDFATAPATDELRKRSLDAIASYSRGGDGSLASLVSAKPVNTVTYADKTIVTDDGAFFKLPKITFIGYTSAQETLIEEFYVALEDQIKTDPLFRNSDEIREFADSNGESFLSLNGGGALRDPRSNAYTAGVTAGLNVTNLLGNEEKVIESIINTVDPDVGGLSDSFGKASFLSRVFHEILHERSGHSNFVYDETVGIEGNLKPLTIADVRARDLQYGGAERVLRKLATKLKLKPEDIEKIANDGLAGQQVRANILREIRIIEVFRATSTDPLVTQNRQTLDRLQAQGFIIFNEGRIPPGATAEDIEKLRNDDDNYTVNKQRADIIRAEAERQKIPDMQLKGLDLLELSPSEGIFDTLAETVDVALQYAKQALIDSAPEIGQIFGSTLGRQLFRNASPNAQLAASTTLGVIGQNLGEIIENNLRMPVNPRDLNEGFNDIGKDFKAAGVGVLSSYLTAELFGSLGLEGTLAEVGQSVFSSALSAIISNLGTIATAADVVNAVGMINVGQIVGGYIGTRLAQEVISFDTVEGQIGAAVGTAVGGTVGAKIGAQYGAEIGTGIFPGIGTVIGAVIGAFVGYIAGGLLGSLFSGGTPRSSAQLAWDEKTKRFSIGTVTSANKGSKETARSLASSAADALNSIVELSGSKLLDAGNVRAGSYGMRDKNLVYRASDGNGGTVISLKTRDANVLIQYGVLVALTDMLPRLAGGDVFVKRAMASTLTLAGIDPESALLKQPSGKTQAEAAAIAKKFDLNVLLGNISTAKDYAGYLQNAQQINVLIAAEPTSVFAAGWTITLARAIELGLNKRAATDWVGGWNVYLDEVADGVIDGVSLSPARLGFTIDVERNERLFVALGSEGELLDVQGDTIDSSAKDRIVGAAGNDVIVVSGDRIGNTTGLTLNGSVASGAAHQIKVAARLDGGAGDDIIISGDLGNDLIGGDGNDTLVGGKLDDWLFGDAGNDRLFAGNSNYQFADSDAAGRAAALNTVSNGDMLDGGDGDDVLYGSKGSDWLIGGAGVDTLYGGAGGDVLDGRDGDDRGANGEARLLGGGGTDQYIFGYGYGKDVVFDEADNANTTRATGDSYYNRLQQLNAGSVQRNWAGGGDYEVDGSVKGGEDSIAFGPGVGFQDIILKRSGTAGAPGMDLIIQLTFLDPDTGVRSLTGDELVIQDWFESSRKVEWLRFADGEEIRIGDVTSFIVGTSESDVIVGTNGADFLYGGEGNDNLFGLLGDDFGFGGSGNDVVAGDGSNDFVSGGLGDDKVIGGTGNDTVFGDDGTDSVYGGAGSDIVVGGLGDDRIIGGAGNDIFRYQRGDGRDTVLDDLVNNWELVWNGQYTNGYVFDPTSGMVTKNGQQFFDGNRWIGEYDYTDETTTFRRHLGTVNGALGMNSGVDYLEFGAGIDIQDLMLRRNGNDLEIAITMGDGDARSFESVGDRITIMDWYLTGNSIENFVFLATGRHDLSSTTLAGLGTDGADTLTGTAGADWITGNGGDDVITGAAGVDILSGNGGNDTLQGGADADVLYGGDGEDVLDGGAGADQLLGGGGMDIVSYNSATSSGTAVRAFLDASSTNSKEGIGDVYVGIEGLEGTTGADTLGGNSGENVLRGLGGNDVLYGGAGDDVYEVNGTEGQDRIFDAPFTTQEVISAAGVFNSAQYTATWTHLGILSTSSGSRRGYRLVITRNGTSEEVYRSRDGVDFIYATTASTTLPLPAPSTWPVANGQLRAGAARTTNGIQVAQEIFQSDQDGGTDTLSIGANASLSDLTFQRLNSNADLRITVLNTSNYVTITGQNNANTAIENLQLRDGLVADLKRLVLVGETASAEGDLAVGDANANTLNGLAGDDILSGAAGNDSLLGGEGDDILEGGVGSDTLDGGNDAVTAGLVPSATDQTRTYGDTIRYVTSTAAVSIDLAARTASGGHAAGDVIVASNGVATIENVVGSDGYGDTLSGDARANRLVGLGGNDTLDGRAGDDMLLGGVGNDTLRGGDGADNIAGDDGDDILEGGNQNDLLAGGAGNDSLRGDAGEDLLVGGEGNDTLRGGTEDDLLGGDVGDDQLYGELGNDQLAGGEGNDALYGGDGDDALAGEAGNDLLQGEAGNDTYVFDLNAGSDVIVDTAGSNRIAVVEATREQIWLTRSGNDLRIGVIGGATAITVQGYYAASNPSLVREILLGTHSLFLKFSQPLIDAMTAASATPPASMPSSVSALLDTYWHVGNKAVPDVVDQTVNTNEDTPITGTVGAIDHDENITSYAIDTQPNRGSVSINATTGAWTYTPSPNLYGSDGFSIVVTDADNNRSVQRVQVNVASVNDAPSDILLANAPASIDERDHPPTGTILNAVVLGTLSAADVDFPDAGDFATHVFSVPDSRFEIVNGNVLRLKANVALDYEASPTVDVAVTVRDRNGAPGGLSFTKTLTFSVADKDDYFYGTVGNDTLTGQAGRNLLFGLGGNDTLTGGVAKDDLDGGDGADRLFGQAGDDTLLGGLGDDVLEGGAGRDLLRAGDGADTLRGQNDGDFLFGDGGSDLLQGDHGDDQLDGGAANDRLEGGIGADRLIGGTEDDVLIGGAGADRLNGGLGVDTVSYETATAGVIVNLTTTTGSTGDAAGDVFEDTPEIVIGTSYADTITGSASSDRLEGRVGNDVLNGGAGADVLMGGDGNDTLDGQDGNDQLWGGAGDDILIGGNDSDTYLIDRNSGADEIRNFDPNGTDIDVVGYMDITRENLWFARSGNHLVVSVVGSSTQTSIRDWYMMTTADERSNYKIDFFLAGEHVSKTIDAEALVQLMASRAGGMPTTQAEYDAWLADPVIQSAWAEAWRLNAPPSVPVITSQTVNEDGTLTLGIQITDDFTPANGITVSVKAVRVADNSIEDLSLVQAPTLGAPDANGNRMLTVATKPNASGQVAIKVTAVDAGGLVTERVFVLTVNPVADAPTVTLAQVATPVAPVTKPTLDSGSLAINVQAALVDQDGSETLEVRIANVPTGLTLSAGTNLGSGVWSLTPAQLSGLRIQGPATWSQDLALSITAISRETATGQTATSAAVPLSFQINARPTDIAENKALSFNENTPAGTSLATFLRTDGDAGDTATFELLNNAGGRFALSSSGALTAGNTNLDYEAATSHTITVRVTDSGGLSRTEDFTVNVVNVNEAPTNIVPSGYTVAYENLPAGIEVTRFSATDPENNVTSYSLVNSAGGRFQLSSSGVLTTGSTMLNYEEPVPTITVRATDAGGLFRDQSFGVGIIDLAEAPTINGAAFTVFEGTGAGPGSYLTTTSGAHAQVTGNDPDGGALSYSLVGGDTSVFSIDTAGYLRRQAILDYETRQNYSVTVRATDSNGLVADTVVPITVANVAPRVTEARTTSYTYVTGTPRTESNTYVQLRLGLVAADPGGGAITSMRIVGGSIMDRINAGTVQYFDGDITGSFGTPEIERGYLVERLRSAGSASLFAGMSVVVETKDASGAVGYTNIQITANGILLSPVVFDLDGDGVNLISRHNSSIVFDADANGVLDNIGWVGSGDAVLALDRNGDGVITNGIEISFVQDTSGATTDLEGLVSYDTNGNGSLDESDARYDEFLVWQDANQDGVSQRDELRSLADRGIVSISLERTLTGQSTEGATDNVITATSQFVRRDGSTGTVGDVALAYGDVGVSVQLLGDTNDVAAVAPSVADTPEPDSISSEDDNNIDYVDRLARGKPAEVAESHSDSSIDFGGDVRGSTIGDEVEEANRPPSDASPSAGGNDVPEPAPRPARRSADVETASREDDVQAAPSATKRPWRWSDLPQAAVSEGEEDWSYAGTATRGALHSSLDSVSRRRLQMVEAMASFNGDKGAALDLMPRRKIDPRTYEMLTANAELTKVM